MPFNIRIIAAILQWVFSDFNFYYLELQAADDTRRAASALRTECKSGFTPVLFITVGAKKDIWKTIDVEPGGCKWSVGGHGGEAEFQGIGNDSRHLSDPDLHGFHLPVIRYMFPDDVQDALCDGEFVHGIKIRPGGRSSKHCWRPSSFRTPCRG
jgi:hypothetical protein